MLMDDGEPAEARARPGGCCRAASLQVAISQDHNSDRGCLAWAHDRLTAERGYRVAMPFAAEYLHHTVADVSDGGRLPEDGETLCRHRQRLPRSNETTMTARPTPPPEGDIMPRQSSTLTPGEGSAPTTAERPRRIHFWICAPEAAQLMAAIEAQNLTGDVCVAVSPVFGQQPDGLGLMFEEDLDKVMAAIRQRTADPAFSAQFKHWLQAHNKSLTSQIQKLGEWTQAAAKIADLLKPAMGLPEAKTFFAELFNRGRESSASSRDIDEACVTLRERARDNLERAAFKSFLALTDTDEAEARDGDNAAAWRVVAFALNALLRGSDHERKSLRYIHHMIASGDIPKAAAVISADAAIEAFHLKDDEALRKGTIAAFKAALSNQDERFRGLEETKLAAILRKAVPAKRGEERARKGGAAHHGPARVAAELALKVGALGSALRLNETKEEAIARLTRELNEATRRAKRRLGSDAT